jgi:putative copper export protein
VRDARAVVDHRQMYYAQNLQTKMITQRILRRVISYVVVLLLAAALLQVFTPFPVLTWLSELTKTLIGD